VTVRTGAEDLRVETEQLAIVVTGAVGLGAPSLAALFGWLREKQHAQRERVEKDLDDLRDLLDQLLPLMFEHTQRLLAFERWVRDATTRRSHADAAPNLIETRRTLYAYNARLVIRLGRDHRLVTVLGHYLKDVDEAWSHVGQIHEEHDVFDADDAELAKRARLYWFTYEGVVDAAKAVVGTVTAEHGE
jgi:hypothetical protein